MAEADPRRRQCRQVRDPRADERDQQQRPLLYRTLSGVAHHAPWIAELHMPPTRPDDGGMYYGTQISQGRQVNLVANVCHALLTTATTKARFYGAATDDLHELGKSSIRFFVSLADTIMTMERG